MEWGKNRMVLDGKEYEEVEKGIYKACGMYYMPDQDWPANRDYLNYSAVYEAINDEYRILYLGDIRENTFDRLCEISDKERASTTNRIYINYGVLDGLKYDLLGTGLYIIE